MTGPTRAEKSLITSGAHPVFEMSSYPKASFVPGPETGPGARSAQIVPTTISFEVAQLVMAGEQPRLPTVAELAAILRAAAVTVEGPR